MMLDLAGHGHNREVALSGGARRDLSGFRVGNAMPVITWSLPPLSKI
jgi:hypothetical protein